MTSSDPYPNTLALASRPGDAESPHLVSEARVANNLTEEARRLFENGPTIIAAVKESMLPPEAMSADTLKTFRKSFDQLQRLCEALFSSLKGNFGIVFSEIAIQKTEPYFSELGEVTERANYHAQLYKERLGG